MNQIKSFIKHNLRPGLFLASIFLSGLMLVAADWQWRRYHEKLILVETYKSHSENDSIPFENFKEALHKLNTGDSTALSAFLNKKVTLMGEFDFQNQKLVINRRTKHGAGSWLLTPLKLEGVDYSIVVNRGFIPYEEKNIDSWKKYEIPKKNSPMQFQGVVTASTSKRSSLSPKAQTSNPAHFLYPDIPLITESIPYPTVSNIYIQGILDPVVNEFPLTDIKIDVPPSTHFWYTFEWIALAILTQVIVFAVQLFRPHSRPKNE